MLKISNRSRYSSSTASGRQSLIMMSADDYERLTYIREIWSENDDVMTEGVCSKYTIYFLEDNILL